MELGKDKWIHSKIKIISILLLETIQIFNIDIIENITKFLD